MSFSLIYSCNIY